MIIKKNTERISAFNLIPNGAGQLPTSYNIFSTLDTCWNKIIVRKKIIIRTIETRLSKIPTFQRKTTTRLEKCKHIDSFQRNSLENTSTSFKQ